LGQPDDRLARGGGACSRQVYYVSHEILSEKEEEVLEFMKGQVPDGVTVAEITAVRRTPPPAPRAHTAARLTMNDNNLIKHMTRMIPTNGCFDE
jgi:hypothetical protein